MSGTVTSEGAPPFFVETQKLDQGERHMSWLRVSIYERTPDGPRRIGEYTRKHAGLYDTFLPFRQGGQWFALYSADYTTTRVMRLPSCEDIAGEKPHPHGFCPVEFHVPYVDPQVVAAGHAGLFGFVAGCIWGDDSSWKIQYLDLSRITSGELTRDERFGYLPLPHDRRLADCVDLSGYWPPEYPRVRLSVARDFDLTTGQDVTLD